MALNILPALDCCAQNLGEPWVSGTAVDGVSLRGGLVAWKRQCSLATSDGAIRRRPENSGTESLLVSAPGCPAFGPWSRVAEVESGGTVYWCGRGGFVYSLPAGTTSPAQLCPMEEPGSFPPCTGLSAARVFWGEVRGEVGGSGRVFYVPKSGGARTLVVNTDAFGPGPRQVVPLADNDVLTLLESGRLIRSFTVDGSTWISGTEDLNVQSVTAGNGHFYYTVRNPSTNAVSLKGHPVNDSTPTYLIHTVSGASVPVLRDLAVNSSHLFWHQLPGGTGAGPIMRCGLVCDPDSGGPQAITDPFPGDFISLCADDAWLFWADPGLNIIRRLSARALPVSYDLAATGMEVIQAIQRPDNSIPLVAGKTTYARLFGRILTNTNGSPSLSLTAPAFLYGTTNGGIPLPGSPLRVTIPRTPGPITTAAPNRQSPAEGFLFQLPDEWTVQGPIVLRGVVNPVNIITEANFANNAVTVNASFQRKTLLCVEVASMWYAGGPMYSTFQRAYQPIFDRVASVMPVPKVSHYWNPGTSIVNSGFLRPDRAFNLMVRAEANEAVDELDCTDVFSDPPRECRLFGGRRHSIAFYRTGAAGSMLGLGTVGGKGLISTLDLSPVSNVPANSPRGGWTLAHELAHNLSQLHVGCGGPAGVDMAYPYPGGSFCDAAGNVMGFDTISRTFSGIMPFIADIQSYCQPAWVSDYTYNRMRNNIPNLPSGVIVPRSRPRGPLPGLFLLARVSASGTMLAPAFLLPDDASRQRLADRLAAPGGDVTTWEFASLRADGSTIQTVSARAGLYSEADTDTDWQLAALMPEHSDTAKIVLRRTGLPGTLASLNGGGDAPTAAFTYPAAAGTEQAAPFTAEWTATDPEGMTLTSIIRYSFDGGANWSALNINTPATSMQIDPAQLPGGSDCRLQLLVSDGIRTSAVTSPQFKIARKAPVATIFMENERGRQCDLTTMITTAGEPVVLHGTGADLEDGNVEDAGLQWTITGPESRTAAGALVEVAPLRPGTYTVTLTATDSDFLTGTDTVTLVVEKVAISDSAGPLVLDGVPDEPAWNADRYPQSIPYHPAEALAPASVRMVHHAGALWVSVTGLANGFNSAEWFGLAIDRNNSGGSWPQPGDFHFDVFASGAIRRTEGNGSAFAAVSPAGFEARVSRPGAEWHVEMRIPDALLGGWDGRPVRIDAAHFHRDYSGDDFHWFDLDPASYDWPDQWAPACFGASATDPYDSDHDNMPDSWERTWFGSIAHKDYEDADGDGQTNGDEYAAGTSPVNGASSFNARFSGGGVIVPTGTQRSYTLWRSTDMSSWEPAGLPVEGTGAEIGLPAATGGRCYYKVTARPCR